jgi:integrase/recombinase XerC
MNGPIKAMLEAALKDGHLTTDEVQQWIDRVIPDAPTVAAAVDQIIATAPYAPTTMRLYTTQWRRFSDAFGEQLITELTWPQIRDLGVQIQQAAARGDDGPSGHVNDGKRARLTYHSALRALYADASGRIGRQTFTSPAHQAELPRPSRNPNRRSLDDHELIEVVDVVASRSWDPRLHNLLIPGFLETGGRRKALLRLPLGRLDQVHCTAVLHEKNDKRHVALLSPATATAIGELACERGSTSPTDPAFRSKSGSPANDHTVDRLFAMIRRHLPWAAEIGLSAHHLRHTHAARMERAGQSEAIAAATLGHAQRTVTSVYTSARGREIIAAWQKVFEVEHPLWRWHGGGAALPPRLRGWGEGDAA